MPVAQSAYADCYPDSDSDSDSDARTRKLKYFSSSPSSSLFYSLLAFNKRKRERLRTHSIEFISGHQKGNLVPLGGQASMSQALQWLQCALIATLVRVFFVNNFRLQKKIRDKQTDGRKEKNLLKSNFFCPSFVSNETGRHGTS